jgi:arginase
VQDWTILGVPSSAGAHHGGQELAPAAMRSAGLPARLADAGLDVADAGDLPHTPFAHDTANPRNRSLGPVAAVAGQVADVVSDIVAAGRRPVVLGGDCTITLGVVAGTKRHHHDVGMVYLDGDIDMNTPDTTTSGILDAMGVAHLLGLGAAELSGLGGAAPLLPPERLGLLGFHPQEVSESGRRMLDDHRVFGADGLDLAWDPAGTAHRVITKISAVSGPVLVHFDVDVVDSGELPLGNFPHYGAPVGWEAAMTALRTLCRHPSCAGLILTEVNPTHDPHGTMIERYVAGVVTALSPADPERGRPDPSR